MSRGAFLAPRRKPLGRWFWSYNEIFDHFGSRIGYKAVALYTAMSRWADNETGVCARSIGDLAGVIDMSKSAAREQVKILLHHRLVMVYKAARGCAGALYRLTDVRHLRETGEGSVISDHPVDNSVDLEELVLCRDRSTAARERRAVACERNASAHKEERQDSKTTSKSPLPPFEKGGEVGLLEIWGEVAFDLKEKLKVTHPRFGQEDLYEQYFRDSHFLRLLGSTVVLAPYPPMSAVELRRGVDQFQKFLVACFKAHGLEAVCEVIVADDSPSDTQWDG